MENYSDAAKKSRAKYMREYRRKNPDKVKKMNYKYWERRAEREAKQSAEAVDTKS